MLGQLENLQIYTIITVLQIRTSQLQTLPEVNVSLHEIKKRPQKRFYVCLNKNT